MVAARGNSGLDGDNHYIVSRFFGWLRNRQTSPGQQVRLLRLTDFTGLEEYPAISPDGKSVAFAAEAGGKRQIWVRLLAGGTLLQVTHDASDHLYPRWVARFGIAHLLFALV